MFSEIFIDDYCNFNRFKIDFPNYRDGNSPNLNILVGRNGSGKSSLLDALFEIGKNNLKTNYKEKYGNVPFDYEVLYGNTAENVICSNIQEEDNYHPDREKHLWDKVIRLYTGHTKRQNQRDIYESSKFIKESTWLSWQENDVISLENKDTKWALLALFMSGKWQDVSEEAQELWGKIQKVVLGNKPETEAEYIKPKLFWLETNELIREEYGEKNEFTTFLDEAKIRHPDFTMQTKSDQTYRHYWELSEENPISENSKDWSLNLLLSILGYKNKAKRDFNDTLTFYNTGFLFNKYPNEEKLFPDQSLSDGEHAFLTRFALLMILREAKKDEKYLVLLDEPETHFNEYWKTYFLYLVCKALGETNHDVFIATHSAMLITDAKPDEIHRLEARESGSIAWPTPIKTYGANVVDIGTSLFRMEADIGERSRLEITEAINKSDKAKLEDLLKQVGPGEWRWRIRAKLKEIESIKRLKSNVSTVES